MDDAERQTRAEKRRRSATLLRTRLDADNPDMNPIRGEEALSLVWSLTRTSWSLAQREIPQYSRTETPYRFVRGRLT